MLGGCHQTDEGGDERWQLRVNATCEGVEAEAGGGSETAVVSVSVPFAGAAQVGRCWMAAGLGGLQDIPQRACLQPPHLPAALQLHAALRTLPQRLCTNSCQQRSRRAGVAASPLPAAPRAALLRRRRSRAGRPPGKPPRPRTLPTASLWAPARLCMGRPTCALDMAPTSNGTTRPPASRAPAGGPAPATLASEWPAGGSCGRSRPACGRHHGGVSRQHAGAAIAERLPCGTSQYGH